MELNILVLTLVIVGSTAKLQCDDQEHCTHADEGNHFKFFDPPSSMIFYNGQGRLQVFLPEIMM